jgi:hypothetical protein
MPSGQKIELNQLASIDCTDIYYADEFRNVCDFAICEHFKHFSGIKLSSNCGTRINMST